MKTPIDTARLMDEVREIAAELNQLLKQDMQHRLGLNKYSDKHDENKWSQDLVKRALLAESLNKKLEILTKIEKY